MKYTIKEFKQLIRNEVAKVLNEEVGQEIIISNKWFKNNYITPKKGAVIQMKDKLYLLREPVSGYADSSKNNGWWARHVEGKKYADKLGYMNRIKK